MSKPSPSESAAATGTSLSQLEAVTGEQAEKIFAPLDRKSPSVSRVELQSLRNRFAASASAPNRIALQLCDTLLLGLQEREQALRSLSETRAKPHAVSVQADKNKEAADKKRFFELAVTQRWSETANRLRDQVTNLSARLRTEESQKAPALAPIGRTAKQPGDMIVLQRATPVRLKYGSTILLAGLSLRVVGETASGLTVEHAGEEVVVPLQ